MKKRYVVLLLLGLCLLVWSATPLWLMAQELIYERQAKNGIKFDRIYVNFLELNKVEILGKGTPIPVTNITIKNDLMNGKETIEMKSYQDYHDMVGTSDADSMNYIRTYFWGENTIKVEDQFRPSLMNSEQYEESSLKITINDKDWSVSSPVEVRPNELDENRYHGYFGLLSVEDNGVEQLVLVQRVSGTQFKLPDDLAWRMLTLESNGQVHEVQFSYEERAVQPKTVDFINLTNASPISLGYKSNILQGWPSLFFPLLYPFVSGLLGLILTVIGSLLMTMRVRKARTTG